MDQNPHHCGFEWVISRLITTIDYGGHRFNPLGSLDCCRVAYGVLLVASAF